MEQYTLAPSLNPNLNLFDIVAYKAIHVYNILILRLR